MTAYKALKRAGYALALRDFVDRPEFEPLIELADFVKIDFLAIDLTEDRNIADRYSSRVRLLVEGGDA